MGVDFFVRVQVDDAFQSQTFKKRIVDLVRWSRSVEAFFNDAVAHWWEKHQ